MSKKLEINPNKVVVFSGAGISVESKLPAFRMDSGSLWNNYDPEKVATASALKNDPRAVIDFFNNLKLKMDAATPNSAHFAIAELEKHYDVIVITTNLDNLHEKSGSTNVLHVHGDISKARSQIDSSIEYKLMPDQLISYGQRCELDAQIRPDVVLFGEIVTKYSEAKRHFRDAARVLVVGSSLSVVPTSNMIKAARGRAQKYIVTPDVIKQPFGFKHYPETATCAVPMICSKWIKEFQELSL